jgi:hypothetical protein
MNDRRTNNDQSSPVPEVCDGVATGSGGRWDDILVMIDLVGLMV